MPVTPNYDLDVDASLGGSNASDYVIPSQKAIKTYVDNNGGAYTAGTGIDITSDVISVTNPTLTNTGYNGTEMDSSSVNVKGLTGETVTSAVSVGINSRCTNPGGTAVGNDAQSFAFGATAIGSSAHASASHAIQLGIGTNSEANSLYVGTASSYNWKLLDSNGLIPDARISSNIARSADVPTAVSQLTNDSGYITGISSGDVTTALGYTPADDTDVVKLSGNQTVAGEKTFTDKVLVEKTTPVIEMHYPNVTKGTNPSSDAYWNISLTDKDGNSSQKRLGVIETALKSTGEVNVYMLAYKNQANATTNTGLTLVYPTTDDPYAILTAPKFNIQNSDMDRGSTTPTANHYANVDFLGSGGTLLGSIYVGYYTNGTRALRMPIYNTSGSGSQLAVLWDSSNGFYTYAPPTDVNNSIVTTVNKSKGANGYFKLGNGLIVQWGRASGTGNRSVTLPTAFTSSNYKVVVSPYNGSVSSTTWGAYNQTTTGFDIVVSASSGMNANWIAIGY